MYFFILNSRSQHLVVLFGTTCAPAKPLLGVTHFCLVASEAHPHNLAP